MFDSVTLEMLDGLGPCDVVLGVDEVGRGSWAGPAEVGVAAISAEKLREVLGNGDLLEQIDDSKKLSAKRRLAGLEMARARFDLSVGSASPLECDELGLSRALRVAFDRAVATLDADAALVLLDGRHNYLACTGVTTVVRGDARSVVIAAASLAAKVHRDGVMIGLAGEFPHWHFEDNKGYGSAAHAQALLEHGLSAIHRKSWRYVDNLGL